MREVHIRDEAKKWIKTNNNPFSVFSAAYMFADMSSSLTTTFRQATRGINGLLLADTVM